MSGQGDMFDALTMIVLQASAPTRHFGGFVFGQVEDQEALQLFPS